MNTANNNNAYGNNGAANNKFKPYRNRPGMRQSILELLSFFLLLASAPAFLGGVFSIFIAIATFCLAIIGLFAWTRRHARFFVILAIALIAGCIVNIILRATFHAQCVPFYEYRNNFGTAQSGSNSTASNSSASTGVAGGAVGGATTGFVEGTAAGSTTGNVNSNNTIFVGILSNLTNENNATQSSTGTFSSTGASNNNGFIGGSTINGNKNTYDNSIWCGNNYILYITNAIILALAIPALLLALAALAPRNKTPAVARTTETTSTHTRTTEAY